MKRNGAGRIKLNHRRMWSFIVLGLLIIVLVTVPAVAKYLSSRNVPQNILDTEMFYFTSDLLNESKDNSIKLDPSASTFSFELRNFADELRYSETDIHFEVKVRATEDGQIAFEQPKIDVDTGTLRGGKKEAVTVTISGLERGVHYSVTATGENAYVQTLNATLTRENSAGALYKHLATFDDYVLLTVWTTGKLTGQLNMSFPSGLIPDNTDVAMREWTTGDVWADSISFQENNASHRYRFFLGGSSKPPTVEQFTVSINRVRAEVGTPGNTN